MPFISGTATVGGDMPHDLQARVTALIRLFDQIVAQLSAARNLRQAVVRSQLGCNTTALLDRSRLWLIAERSRGMPGIRYFDRPALNLHADGARDIGVWDLGYQDPFVIGLPRLLVDASSDEQSALLEQHALDWVESEERRTVAITQLVRLEPLFGQPRFLPDPRLCFIIMPFADQLTHIYEQIIKPLIEQHDLVCKRADDIRSNQAIMQDIWKSICEARVVVADLTSGNANVFYELGIAHTVGKETILICQRQEVRRPFDVLHLRTIIYDDTVLGGEHLKRELGERLRAILEPVILTSDQRA